MNNERKNITINILGNEYHIITDESYDSLSELALMIENSMKDLSVKINTQNQSVLAVLTALKLGHDLQILQQESAYVNKVHEKLVNHINEASYLFNLDMLH